MPQWNDEEPDELDKQIVRLLSRHARQTNKSLAQRTGVSEITIANRLRRMAERGIARVVGVLDQRLAGYNINVVLFIKVSGRSEQDVALDLAKFSEIKGVSIVRGRFDIVSGVTVADNVKLREFIETKLALVAGIASIEYDLLLEAVGYREEWARLLS